MSTTCASNSLGLCASLDTAVVEGDNRRTKVMSLRRTLSADMSSKTLSVETGFSSIKRIVAPDHVIVDHSPDDADGRRLEKDELNRPTQIDIWTSILSQKNDSHSAVPPPYVHPLVKRSASLSKKSLEICTESLGSETGSDVFTSAFPTPDIGSDDVKTETEKSMVDEKLPQIVDAAEEVQVARYNGAYHNKKNSSSRPRSSFPPPLPSLASRDGASLHMHSRRENGRLVLAAVSIPTQNNFRAQRQDGRLLLTFVNENKSDMPEATEKNGVIDKAEDELKEVFNNNNEEINKNDVVVSDDLEDGEFEEDLEEVNTKKKNMTVETPNVAASGVIHVHRPTFIVNKVIRLTSRQTSIWTNKFNEVVKVELQADDQEATDQLDPKSSSVARSLASQPRLTSLTSSTPPSMTSALTTAASCFNAYEYCWRRKATSPTTPVFKTSTSDTPLISSAPISKIHNMFILTKAGKHQNEETVPTKYLVLKGKRGEAEFIVPYFKGCKDQKRSLLYREPYCIATS